MEEWQNQGQTNLLGRRRHSTPPGGTPRAAVDSQAVGTEGEESEHTQDHPDDFIDVDGTVYGAPPTDAEPEPHGRPDEPMETSVMEGEPENEEEHSPMQKQMDLSNRMEKLRHELEGRMHEAALVGDELEAQSLRLQMANVVNLQFSLPRPSI